ncbi:MAG: hypothetical protein COB20_11800 [SAR86 cluster bacterium]|uniref:DUF484 domain-containing protein n=1 Tax=SAR86 cluster bacterium TaxID=2030880 RepID=A0A2A4X030_9GAMM|nr:MAG: hypothetical protein COB20_11800 [SAR86 cluster bacterium]
MKSDNSAAEKIETQSSGELSAEEVASYLKANPEFFIEQEELLADLSLPHESGKAISLLERQVTILRDRGADARQKLNNLLENARNNDQLFDTTRNLVLALLRAKDVTEIANVTQDQLSNHTNIDSCEVILVDKKGLKVADSVRTEPEDILKKQFADVFRLKRTHCGSISEEQTQHLFPAQGNRIKSTALCPVISNGNVLALIAFGNQSDNYFNVNLDTLFLDFIGHVVGAVLDSQLADSAQ